MFRSTRRAALLGAAAVLAAPAIPASVSGVTEAAAQEPVRNGQAPGYFRFKFGDAAVTAIYDGYFARPLKGFIRGLAVL